MTDAKSNTPSPLKTGAAANPKGRPRKTFDNLLQKHGMPMLERAFVEAKTDPAVLAGLLHYLASCNVVAASAAAVASPSQLRH